MDHRIIRRENADGIEDQRAGIRRDQVCRRAGQRRADGLYEADRLSYIKTSQQNMTVQDLYKGLLKGKEHELLHVHYHGAK